MAVQNQKLAFTLGCIPMNKTEKFRALMERVFDELREGLRDELGSEEYEQRRHSFGFHMTDWLDDIETVKALWDNCESVDSENAAKQVAGFLYHVIPHLAEAGNLLLDNVENPFSKVEQPPA